MLEKIVEKINSSPPENSGFNYKFGEKEWTLSEVGIKLIANPCIKTVVAGLTFSGSMFYGAGRLKYNFEKMMLEKSYEMDQREQKYKLSARQHYATNYQKRRDSWTLKYKEN